eukprot:Skav230122  [mRNA]  locus=scaffold2192:32895:33431:+ [translate_table: standard]
MKRSVPGDGNHPDIAAILHELGIVSRKAGDLEQAKLLLEESLLMKRSVPGDGNHPDIAATLHELGIALHELGIVSRKAGDLEQAKMLLEESLLMKRSVHGDGNHPDIAETLQEIGVVSQEAADLVQEKLQLAKSFQRNGWMGMMTTWIFLAVPPLVIIAQGVSSKRHCCLSAFYKNQR